MIKQEHIDAINKMYSDVYGVLDIDKNNFDINVNDNKSKINWVTVGIRDKNYSQDGGKLWKCFFEMDLTDKSDLISDVYGLKENAEKLTIIYNKIKSNVMAIADDIENIDISNFLRLRAENGNVKTKGGVYL